MSMVALEEVVPKQDFGQHVPPFISIPCGNFRATDEQNGNSSVLSFKPPWEVWPFMDSRNEEKMGLQTD